MNAISHVVTLDTKLRDGLKRGMHYKAEVRVSPQEYGIIYLPQSWLLAIILPYNAHGLSCFLWNIGWREWAQTKLTEWRNEHFLLSRSCYIWNKLIDLFLNCWKTNLSQSWCLTPQQLLNGKQLLHKSLARMLQPFLVALAEFTVLALTGISLLTWQCAGTLGDAMLWWDVKLYTVNSLEKNRLSVANSSYISMSAG